MPTQLLLKLPDKDPTSYSSLKFSVKTGLPRDGLYLAEIEPPLKIGKNESLKYIYFNDFIFVENELTFMTPNESSITLPDDLNNITLTIIGPEPVPSWSSPLTSAEDDLIVLLFYHSQDQGSPETNMNYLETLKIKWSTISSRIEELVDARELGKYGLSIGIVDKAFQVPELFAVDAFINSANSYKKGSKIMTVVISSFNEFTLSYKGKVLFTKGVPSIPKDLLLRKIKMIIDSKNENKRIDTPSRRLLKALFNGGIPSKLFSKHPNLLVSAEKVEGVPKYFQEDDFDKSVLNLGLLDTRDIDYEQILQQPLDCLKNHLFSTSNEATLRSLFWDPLLTQLFHWGQEGHIKNYRLSSEWRTRNLLPHLEERKVDFEASIKPGTKRYPILIVEAGAEPFDKENVHKDFSKMIGTISLCCISMARDLLELRKKPVNARVYGIWIGRLRMQFCVAHPVLTKLQDGTVEIHAEISYEDEWFFDLLSGSTEQTSSRSAQTTSLLAPKTTPSVASQDSEVLTPGRIYSEEYKYIDLELKPEISKFVSEQFISEEGQTAEPVNIPTSTNEESETPLNVRELNFMAIKRLHAFIEIIKNRINLIMTEAENPNETRILPPDLHFGFIDAARPSTDKPTPNTDQIKQALAAKREAIPTKVTPLKFVKIGKSTKELEIIRKLSLFPNNIFPKVYSIEVDDANVTAKYVFENLLPIVNIYTKRLSNNICSVYPWESLFYCIRFGVNCLMSLHLLHDQLGIVHSDISSNNIMFSFYDDCWKVIDFDQSLDISESLQTPRKAGTPGFVAPESKETGIFSTKSDIYALGKVIMDYLTPLLIHQIILDETDQVGSEERFLFNGFNSIAFSMISADPESRPSAFEALAKMFELLKHYDYDTQTPYFVAVESTLALHTVKSEKEPQECIQTVKKLKLEEEKEPKISNVPLIVQKNIK